MADPSFSMHPLVVPLGLIQVHEGGVLASASFAQGQGVCAARYGRAARRRYLGRHGGTTELCSRRSRVFNCFVLRVFSIDQFHLCMYVIANSRLSSTSACSQRYAVLRAFAAFLGSCIARGFFILSECKVLLCTFNFVHNNPAKLILQPKGISTSSLDLGIFDCCPKPKARTKPWHLPAKLDRLPRASTCWTWHPTTTSAGNVSLVSLGVSTSTSGAVRYSQLWFLTTFCYLSFSPFSTPPCV